MEHFERVHPSSAIHVFTGVLNLREVYALWKLHMKSLRMLSAFGNILLTASKNTENDYLCYSSLEICRFYVTI